MTDVSMRLGGADYYEHASAVFDGRVPINGVDVVAHPKPLVSDVFQGMIQGQYDVAELGLTYFLRMWDTEESPFIALPIFPARNFRHSSVFVNADSGIQRPEDLIGKTVGEFALWGSDPGVWVKGILADEYGVTPDQMNWVIGGTDHPIPSFDWLPQPVPEGVSVRHAGDGETLATMLEAGEIDALLSVDVPQSFLTGTGKIRRLFPDYESVERDFYARTGIFPMMHVVAIRKDFHAENPGVARAVYDAFLTAKDQTQQYYLGQAAKQHMGVITPWFSELFAQNRRLMSDDWWPYGVEKNRHAVDTFLRYHHEQGLSRTLLTSQDIFVPELLGS
ncbi:ABC transporter substrate-binding protein [Microbacterium sp. MPKO10]|uniref:ABC transporter substrate-binding protein n=1 Tax=Microbacterium sp. MPKO10 TaxID=2989818 RepID=UPI00223699B3|nr:ABC transporter substrate-binding protein [Microbacterium sp. MPKO10]MCW4458943.1 ABC transporter substrate-binding protein [Microbacterium sp. MPKO10]